VPGIAEQPARHPGDDGDSVALRGQLCDGGVERREPRSLTFPLPVAGVLVAALVVVGEQPLGLGAVVVQIASTSST